MESSDTREKSVLCFGDSLTWGYNPVSGERHPRHQRWPFVAESHLGSGYHLIEEALNGRTTVVDDPYRDFRSGKSVLPMLLESHSPIDLVVIFLGVNDFKFRSSQTSREVALGILSLYNTVVTSRAGPDQTSPECLIVSPPLIPEPHGMMNTLFRNGLDEVPKLFAELEMASETFPLHLLDAAQIVKPSVPDGIHLSTEETEKLGIAIGTRIGELI
ncbi:MAG: GDSL-type esterase/lipase family protein [Verrucomicrobiota bacterium]